MLKIKHQRINERTQPKFEGLNFPKTAFLFSALLTALHTQTSPPDPPFTLHIGLVN